MLRSIRRAPLHAQLIRRLAVTDKLRVKSRLIGAPRRKLSSFEAISGRHNESVKQTTLSFYSKGVIGHLAEASAVCANGGSVVHATVCSARTASPTDDFLPLTVDYRSRAYAFGRMPQSNGRRERHGTDDEILVARIIDRAIRPLFPKGYVHEVQLTVTAHAADGINDPTIAAVNAASFTLMKSKQPWNGPIGCVRVGLIDGKLVVNPSVDDLEKSEMDLVYAGNSSRPVMIETVAKQVSEATVKDAMKLAQAAVRDIIDAQVELLKSDIAEKTAVEDVQQFLTSVVADTTSSQQLLADSEANIARSAIEATSSVNSDAVLSKAAEEKFKGFSVPRGLTEAAETVGLQDAIQLFRDTAAGKLRKADRGMAEGALATKIKNALSEDAQWGKEHIVVRAMVVDAVMAKALRTVALAGQRVDGRSTSELRQITCNVDVLPSVHGSAFFQRGDTHVLCTTTLGPRHDAKLSWPIFGGPERTENFFLHYDFPPYCTGETGNATATNRRMIGHGNLAERALRPVMPDHTTFPYAVRVFSECTSSNGSSSMASACGATLSLMDAGVPIQASVAGISVGLVTAENISDFFPVVKPSLAPRARLEENSATVTASKTLDVSSQQSSKPYVLLTDIIGTEDHYGDMDFKVAGTAKGVTAVQLDVKLQDGVPAPILEEALDRAREGRLKILESIATTIPRARSTVKDSAPRAEVVKFDPERKAHLVGRGGEMIRFIEEEYDCEVDTTEEGVAYIFGKDELNVKDARMLVQDLVAVVKEGDVFAAEVIDVKDFGAVVKIARAQEALLHVSELTHDAALLKKPITDLVAVGQRLDVQVMMVDMTMGLVKVSRKRLLDPANPDQLTAHVPQPRLHRQVKKSSGATIGPGGMPTFPTAPPRRWSKEYFKNNVASKDDIAAAVSGNQPLNNAASASSGKKKGGSDNKKGKNEAKDGRKERRDKDRDNGSKVKESKEKATTKSASVASSSMPSVPTDAANGSLDSEDLLSIGFQRSVEASSASSSFSPSSEDNAAVTDGDGDKKEFASTSCEVMIDVRGLNLTLSEYDCREIAKKYGHVKAVKIPMHFVTKKPKGFAFIELATNGEATAAAAALDGYEFRGKKLKASLAKGPVSRQPREPSTSTSTATQKPAAAQLGDKRKRAVSAAPGVAGATAATLVGMSALDELIAEYNTDGGADADADADAVTIETMRKAVSETVSETETETETKQEEQRLLSKLGGDLFDGAADVGGVMVIDENGNTQDIFEVREQAMRQMRIADGDVGTEDDGSNSWNKNNSKKSLDDMQSVEVRDVTEEALVATLDGLDASPPPPQAQSEQKPSASASPSPSSSSSLSAQEVWRKEMEEFNSNIVDVPTPLDDAPNPSRVR